MDLTGKRILITGASRGLGAVCARAFAGMGAHLALMARSSEELEAVRRCCAAPESHVAISVDLTDFAAIPGALESAGRKLGDLDAVLHVAGGGLGLRAPLLSAEELQRLFSLNLVAAAEINRIIAPQMMKRKSGNLVHVASIAASEATGSVGYNTVKAALAAYVRSLGNLLAASDVVACGILPGGFHAPGNSWDRLRADKPEVVARFIEERLPRKRLADASELIPLLAFLCSPAASIMGGCMVPIDAGEGKSYL
jgi:3-oxoacyl-[acyl-carrier protein] reductase